MPLNGAGRLLAVDLIHYGAYLDPHEVWDTGETPRLLAQALPNVPAERIARALAGGDDGLDAMRTILRDAPRFLHPGATLVAEIGHNRAAVELAFPKLPFVWLETGGSSDSVFLIKREDLVRR